MIASLLIAVALASPVAHQGGFEIRVADPIHLEQSVKQIAKEAQAEGRKVVLDFGAHWCEACRFLDSVIEQAGRDPVAKKWVIAHVDVDSLPRGPALGVRFDTIPFLIRVDAKGRAGKTLRGARVFSRPDGASVEAFERFLGG